MPENNLPEEELKKQLTDLITKGNAHASFEQVLEGVPFKDAGIRPEGLPYSIWKLVDHIRITQWDILEFSREANHISPRWPDEYWPINDAPSGEKEWKDCIQQIKEDRYAFLQLVNDPAADLYTPFPHGEGQNLLREALLIADHTSHHLGQIIVLRRLLGDWEREN